MTEIAKMLNTTTGTVNQALVRSRKAKNEKEADSEKPITENKQGASLQNV